MFSTVVVPSKQTLDRSDEESGGESDPDGTRISYNDEFQHMDLKYYQSANVGTNNGSCVKKYTSSSMKGGMQSFYGGNANWESDSCGDQKKSATCAAAAECSWVSLATCVANNATENYCSSAFTEHDTNTAKTKFYITGSDSKFDICGRHRNSNPMCGDGRCDEVWTASCLPPFCEPKAVNIGRVDTDSTLFWTKVSETDTCPEDCASATSCNSANKVLLGYDANKVFNALCDHSECGENDNEYVEYVPSYNNGAVSIFCYNYYNSFNSI